MCVKWECTLLHIDTSVNLCVSALFAESADKQLPLLSHFFPEAFIHMYPWQVCLFPVCVTECSLFKKKKKVNYFLKLNWAKFFNTVVIPWSVFHNPLFRNFFGEIVAVSLAHLAQFLQLDVYDCIWTCMCSYFLCDWCTFGIWMNCQTVAHNYK